MAKTHHPTKETLTASITTCTKNGNALLEDASFLMEWDRSPTALALAVLAQEEFAKAFLLELVAEEILPWVDEVRKSLNRHECKHLLAVVMDWLPVFDIGEENSSYAKVKERSERKSRLMADYDAKKISGTAFLDGLDAEKVSFPEQVAAALKIYRHEQIERIGDRLPPKGLEKPKGISRKIADGLHDRRKQSALYVDIGKDGAVTRCPEQIKREEAEREIARAKALAEMRLTWSDEFYLLKDELTKVFANL